MTCTKTNIGTLYGTINSLATRAVKANETVMKEYLSVTTKITAAKVDTINFIAEGVGKRRPSSLDFWATFQVTLKTRVTPRTNVQTTWTNT